MELIRDEYVYYPNNREIVHTYQVRRITRVNNDKPASVRNNSFSGSLVTTNSIYFF